MKSSFTVLLLAVVLMAGAVAGYVLATSRSPVPTPAVTTSPSPVADDTIIIDAPLPGAVISSPLRVTGRVRGNWFFEASFPVVLTDWDGKILTQTPAQAQGDWMTADWVPFEATLVFASDTTVSSRGALILKKDNPSGLPEHDDSREITVFFK